MCMFAQFCLHGPIRQRRLSERLFKKRFINGLTYLCICNIFMLDSAFYPPWDGKMSTSQRAVMLCSWGSKGRYGLFAGKTV